MAKETELNNLIRPVVESLGFIFWGLEYLAGGKHITLRIFIDSAEGISVDQCAEVSRQVSAVLDVEDPITQEYTLEVSSPGMDRLLFTIEQFQQYANHIIDVRLRLPYDGRRKFKGQLLGLEDQDIVMAIDEHEYLLPIELIEKARVVPQFEK